MCRAVGPKATRPGGSRDPSGAVGVRLEGEKTLQNIMPDIIRAFMGIYQVIEKGGTLFICGNGGSFSDALHISGELMKSFELRRPLRESIRNRLINFPSGDILAKSLEEGLRCIVLGTNLSLASAIQNDCATRNMGYSQELYNLARSGDILLGISTSGNAQNVNYAAITAKAKGLTFISLTGKYGGKLAELADISIKAPSEKTDKVQEIHARIYHTLCKMLEAYFFG